jgi:nitronate monooxygenase
MLPYRASRKDAMRTSFTEMLGIRYPIMQAPIGGAAGPELAAAVSNAGALGSLVIWPLPPQLASQFVASARRSTDHPISVNVRADLGQHDHVGRALDAGADVIHFFWGDPSPYSDQMQSRSARMACTVGDVDEAKRALDAGAAFLVAQGWEAGGHVSGQLRCEDLVPAVVEVAESVPVVAAGGIGDRSAMAAVMGMGAAGVAIGTLFVVAEESAAHPAYKQAVIDARKEDTVIVDDLFDLGWPNAPRRVIRNSTVREWEAAGCPPSGLRPNAGDVLATAPDGSPVLRYSPMHPMAGMSGNVEALPLYAGLSVDHASGILPAAEIVAAFVEQGSM